MDFILDCFYSQAGACRYTTSYSNCVLLKVGTRISHITAFPRVSEAIANKVDGRRSRRNYCIVCKASSVTTSIRCSEWIKYISRETTSNNVILFHKSGWCRDFIWKSTAVYCNFQPECFSRFTILKCSHDVVVESSSRAIASLMIRVRIPSDFTRIMVDREVEAFCSRCFIINRKRSYALNYWMETVLN